MSSPPSPSRLRPHSRAGSFDSGSRTAVHSIDIPIDAAAPPPMPPAPAHIHHPKGPTLDLDLERGHPHPPKSARTRRPSELHERDPGDVDEVFSPGEETPAEILREKSDPYLVTWDGEDDKDNPRNWNRAYRWWITLFGGLLTLNATFASSAPSGAIPGIIEDFGMSTEVATLLIAIFVVGYCVGPLVWGPASESFGRRPIFILSFICYTGFQVGCALAPNTGALLAFRFLGGAFASAPLTNAGAILADIWDADTRGKSMAFFTLAPFAGPALGPIVGGYMAVAGVQWRWLFWVLTIFAGLCTIGIIIGLPETFSPILLAHRAKAIRLRTGDQKYYAAIERADVHWRTRLSNILARPFKVLFSEPMLIAITIYMSFVYGCIYLLFEAFPIVFTEGHGLNEGASGLMFLPLFLGGVVGVGIYLTVFNPRYERAIQQYAPEPVPPEFRLIMAYVGGPLFAIGFFWFGWTSYPSISFWSPMFATGFLGVGVVLIFLSLFNYIIDAYLMVAASALAASTVVRSSFGAGFPLFATQMYEKLDPRWASTLLGCVALLMIPIPVLLTRYGKTLRKKSKYAPTK